MIQILVLTAALAAQGANASDDRAVVWSFRSGHFAISGSTGSSTDDQAITHLFQNLAEDLRRVPSGESAVATIVAVPMTLLAHVDDKSVDSWVGGRAPASYTKVGNGIGNGYIQAAGALAVWTAGELGHRPVIAHVGSDLIRAQVLNGLLTTGVKLAVDRKRPTGSPHSFPSGHTSAAFATATVLAAHAKPAAAVAAYAAAGFVGWCRVRSDQHWLSDVVAASAFGVVAGRAVVRGHPHSWQVVPVTTPGGAALFVVHGERDPRPRGSRRFS